LVGVVGWLEWLVGCLVGWLVGWLVAWLLGWLVGWLVSWTVGEHLLISNFRLYGILIHHSFVVIMAAMKMLLKDFWRMG
jgi:hypothetical protein